MSERVESHPNEMRNIIAEIIISAAEQHLIPNFLNVNRAYKSDGSVVTKADIDTQRFIETKLREKFPHIEFLAEEMPQQEQISRLQQAENGIWILDPLDGTSNFASGFPFFAVSLALLKQGEIELGWVYDPMRREMFTAIRGQGAWLNDQPIRVKSQSIKLKQCLAQVDFKRLSPELITRLAKDVPYSSQRSLGSVALDWCWIAMQRCQVYLHGKQKMWDYAAGWLVLKEAGGYSCTLQGDNVFTPKLEPRSAVAASQQDVFDEWKSFLRIG